MSKDYTGVDNITMIKSLTYKNGSVNCIIFDELFKEFDSYIVFRKNIYNRDMILHSLITDKSKIKFKVQFINKKSMKNFINKNDGKTIKYRKRIYVPDITINDEHTIEITLIKK